MYATKNLISAKGRNVMRNFQIRCKDISRTIFSQNTEIAGVLPVEFGSVVEVCIGRQLNLERLNSAAEILAWIILI